MAKLDLDSPNIHEVDASRDEIRAYFDGKSLPEDLELALDKAQGEAERAPQYVVLRIKA